MCGLVLLVACATSAKWCSSKARYDTVVKQDKFINGLNENLPLHLRLHQLKTFQKALRLESVKDLLKKRKRWIWSAIGNFKKLNKIEEKKEETKVIAAFITLQHNVAVLIDVLKEIYVKDETKIKSQRSSFGNNSTFQGRRQSPRTTDRKMICYNWQKVKHSARFFPQ